MGPSAISLPAALILSATEVILLEMMCFDCDLCASGLDAPDQLDDAPE